MLSWWDDFGRYRLMKKTLECTAKPYQYFFNLILLSSNK